VRTALEKENTKREEDITDSTFLGSVAQRRTNDDVDKLEGKEGGKDGNDNVNPVDDMMKLERELRDIDMTPLNTSIASLAPQANRNANINNTEGSFYILPPNTQQPSSASSSSYLSSSLWTLQNNKQPRAKPSPTHPHHHHHDTVPTNQKQHQYQHHPELESSWWGSTLPTKSTTLSDPHQITSDPNQIIRLLGSIKTLTDENTTLLREIETANAARKEASQIQGQMKAFKDDYSKKFSTLKLALEKFKRDFPTGNNPVVTSDHVQNAESEKKEKIIKKLAADLRKEREESQKKDAALRKYEGFYREVKKRSEQKQRQKAIEEKMRGKANFTAEVNKI